MVDTANMTVTVFKDTTSTGIGNTHPRLDGSILQTWMECALPPRIGATRSTKGSLRCGPYRFRLRLPQHVPSLPTTWRICLRHER